MNNSRTYPEDSTANHPDATGWEWSCEPDDDGTMPDNVAELANLVVGKRIVSAETRKWEAKPDPDTYQWTTSGEGLVLTLNDGTAFALEGSHDCCAYTDLEAFVYHPDKVDNIITAVETEGGYTKWHVLADGSDVLELTVGWSCGNPFYYGYGFDFRVVEVVVDGEVAS